MRISQVDLNLFVVFDAIYTERNLTRAADVLCITQPAVSNALNRLRKTFNDQLFVRTPRGMMPTPVAENIVGRVREALQLLTTSVHEGDRFDPQSANKEFRFSMNDLAEALMLPPLLEYLQKHAPGITVSSYQVPRDQVAKELAAGTTDFAIDVPLAHSPDLHSVALSKDEYVCLVRCDHPLVGEALTLDDYLSLGHIHVSSRRRGLGHVDLALSKLGVQRDIRLRVQHYMIAPGIVRRTNLAWTAPRALGLSLDLKAVELPFVLDLMNWNLSWHKSADGDQANAWMRALITNLSLGA
ncbi:MAG: LysR family transcriptional regulator [Exilibacterium sp.]